MNELVKPLAVVPDGVSTDLDQFIHGGCAPSVVYRYLDEGNGLLSVVCRYEEDRAHGFHRTTLLPWRYMYDEWTPADPPKPRPLYGLPRLAELPEASVLVVSSEECAEAARGVLAANPVVAWPGGSLKAQYADWEPLRGRDVRLWPDADQPGEEAVKAVAAILANLDCSVLLLNTDGQPAGWNVARAVSGGWGKAEVVKFIKTRAGAYRPPVEVVPIPQSRRVKVVHPAPDSPRAQDADSERPSSGSQVELWQRYDLACKKNGEPHGNLDNCVKILMATVDAKALHFDTFLNQIRYDERGSAKHVKLRDEHILAFQLRIQRQWGLYEARKSAVEDAVAILARQRQVNCLQQWLAGLSWDGTARLETLFAIGFGAEDTGYTRSVGRAFLISMVARAMRPGCQVDTMPILEGAQGIGKSRGLHALAGDFYADVDAPIGSKEFSETVQGKWLIEISELSAMRASEIERVKSGITRTVDIYREPYARLATDHPRQCVFAGTTNATHYLTDDENRRFWPVRCGRIDRTWLVANREQLFAEARVAFESGASYWDVDRSEAKREVDARMVVDEMQSLVDSFLETRPACSVTVRAILEQLDVPVSQWTSVMQRRVGACLRARGYVTRRVHGANEWVPPNGHSAAEVMQLRRKSVRKI